MPITSLFPNASDGADSVTARDMELRAELLGKLYGAALEPERLDDVLADWDALVVPQWHLPSRSRRAMLEGSGLLPHMQQLNRMLNHVRRAAPLSAEEAELKQFRRSAAFTINGALNISAANAAAVAMLGVGARQGLHDLTLRADDRAVLARVADGMLNRRGGATEQSRLARARRVPDDHLILLQLRLVTPEKQPKFVLVVTTEMYWPEGSEATLRDAFGLTQAETEVLMALTQSRTLSDIAAARGRSVDTIRTQIKAIQTKTEARGQNELVKLAMTTMDFAPSDPDRIGPASDAPAAAPRVSRGGQELLPLPYRSLTRPDGRRVDYLEFGATDGRPVMYLSSNLGLCRWPADAERMAMQMGLRVIAPIRPGFGGSTPLRRGQDRVGAVAADMVALLDHLRIASVPLLVLDEDMIFAARMHHIAPRRVTAVLGCGALLPLTRPEQYERMGRWHRFILGTARYTPQVLPFMITTGFAMARRMGKAEFVQLVYAGSKADCDATTTPRIQEALDSGSDIVLREGFDAAKAYAAEVTAMHRGHWADELEELAANVPMINLVGTEDQAIPPATLAEFRETHPGIKFESVADAGSFLFFQKWPLALEHLEALMRVENAPATSE